MLLQFAFLVAFWSGIYILRERATAISADLQRQAEIKKFEGKWQSMNWEGITLELRAKRFVIAQNGAAEFRGDYFRSDGQLTLATRTALGYGGSFRFRYQHTGESLVLWGSDGFRRSVLVRLLGRDVAFGLPEDAELRFRRVSE